MQQTFFQAYLKNIHKWYYFVSPIYLLIYAGGGTLGLRYGNPVLCH